MALLIHLHAHNEFFSWNFTLHARHTPTRRHASHTLHWRWPYELDRATNPWQGLCIENWSTPNVVGYRIIAVQRVLSNLTRTPTCFCRGCLWHTPPVGWLMAWVPVPRGGPRSSSVETDGRVRHDAGQWRPAAGRRQAEDGGHGSQPTTSKRSDQDTITRTQSSMPFGGD